MPCPQVSPQMGRTRLCAWCLACSLLLASTVQGTDQRYIEDEDRFPGWKGVLPSQAHQQPAAGQEPIPETTGYGENGQVRLPHGSGPACSSSSSL